jgi:CDP-6-deoxy-D-xylo-4-hexulose-3-dehydrase
MISLVNQTITIEELQSLCSWIQTNPRLTKYELNDEFEKKWSEWLGRKHSIFVNSGSSANLAAFYAIKLSGRLKNNKVILPTVSWATTVSPAIQLGLDPILCDCNLNNLGLDLEHLEELIDKHNPSLIVAVNVLGFANNYDRISQICRDRDILLLEDSCESIGTVAYGKKTGCFGDVSTFSFFYGHHMSTIEGGMVCTDDDDLANLIRSIRSHGWDRDLTESVSGELKKKYSIDEFNSPYTFYYPGFNVRCTEIQAFLGISQLRNIDHTIQKRCDNFALYEKLLGHISFLSLESHSLVSNFCYPIIHEKSQKICNSLFKEEIAHRPLIAGSISKQPFWTDRYGYQSLKNGDKVHEYGFYVPNNHQILPSEIEFICDTINREIT